MTGVFEGDFASGPEDGIRLTPPRRMTLEQAIGCSRDDGLVEGTLKMIRIRKLYLEASRRSEAT